MAKIYGGVLLHISTVVDQYSAGELYMYVISLMT